jgi:hypothetical protein
LIERDSGQGADAAMSMANKAIRTIEVHIVALTLMSQSRCAWLLFVLSWKPRRRASASRGPAARDEMLGCRHRRPSPASLGNSSSHERRHNRHAA